MEKAIKIEPELAKVSKLTELANLSLARSSHTRGETKSRVARVGNARRIISKQASSWNKHKGQCMIGRLS